jgi:hypothetical protein
MEKSLAEQIEQLTKSHQKELSKMSAEPQSKKNTADYLARAKDLAKRTG